MKQPHALRLSTSQLNTLLEAGYQKADAFTAAKIMGISSTCRRCGGTGHHSFNFIDATMCYGCNGKGWVCAVFTKAQMVRLVKPAGDTEAVQVWANKVAAARTAKAEKAEALRAEKAAAHIAAIAEWEAAQAKIKANTEKAETEAKAAKYTNTRHLGQPGVRVDFTATVRFVDWYPSSFGYGQQQALTFLELADGSTVKYRNFIAQKGEVVNVRATVKEHTTDNRTGAKMTVIQRAKVLQAVPA